MYDVLPKYERENDLRVYFLSWHLVQFSDDKLMDSHVLLTLP